MGFTIKNAFIDIDVSHPDAKKVIARASTYNQSSETNGGLMRITPLAVWAHNLNDEELQNAVIAEDSLTHANKNANDAAVSYCLCIKFLIKNPGKRNEAVEYVK